MAIWASVNLGPGTRGRRPPVIARRDFETLRLRPMTDQDLGDSGRGWPSWPTVPAFTRCAWRKWERRIIAASLERPVSVYFRFSGYGVGGDRRRPSTVEAAYSTDRYLSPGRFERIREARGFSNT